LRSTSTRGFAEGLLDEILIAYLNGAHLPADTTAAGILSRPGTALAPPAHRPTLNASQVLPVTISGRPKK
jgi:hypothetical protein